MSAVLLNFHDWRTHPIHPIALSHLWSPDAPDSDSTLETIAASIDTLHLPVLYTHPTDLLLFARALQKLGKKPQIGMILTSGQELEPGVREYTEKYFNCQVRSFYSTREAFAVAFECPKQEGSFHVNDAHIVVEILDPVGQSVSAGTWGDIVITSLDNHAMPLLRYRMGDSGRTIPNACACGLALTCIEIRGRTAESIKLPDGTEVLVRDIGYVLLNKFFSRIRRYQIREERDAVKILIVPEGVTLDEVSVSEIKKEVSTLLRGKLAVVLEQTDDIPKAGNKLKRFVPRTRDG